MKIDKIYIPCYRRDIRLARILIASIRHWYPNIPIVLIKDELLGKFDTAKLEKFFNVSVLPSKTKKFGWGFSKFEILFPEHKERFLLLDADIILAGPVIDLLEKFDDDFIVCNEPFSKENLIQYYFDLDKLLEFDPSFQFPDFTFNTGQLVGTSGIFTKKDFDPFIDWSEPRVMLHRKIFTFGGEQPVFNYLFMKKMTQGEATLRRFDFMREGLHPDTQAVELSSIVAKKGYPFIIHWHDKKPNVYHPTLKEIPRNDLLLYFEDIYYDKISASKIQQDLNIYFENFYDKVKMKYLPYIKKTLSLTNNS
jgi:hypothetical protein